MSRRSRAATAESALGPRRLPRYTSTIKTPTWTGYKEADRGELVPAAELLARLAARRLYDALPKK